MKSWFRFVHLKGLPDTLSGRNVILRINPKHLQFSTKQIIPYSRLIGLESSKMRKVLKGSPVASALGYGLLGLFLTGFFFGLLDFYNSEFLGMMGGVVAAIIGAIKGLQPVEREITVLSVFYWALNGKQAEITLQFLSKQDQKDFSSLAKRINDLVEYMPSSEFVHTEKKVPYEI